MRADYRAKAHVSSSLWGLLHLVPPHTRLESKSPLGGGVAKSDPFRASSGSKEI
jgi:hypothetical protein